MLPTVERYAPPAPLLARTRHRKRKRKRKPGLMLEESRHANALLLRDAIVQMKSGERANLARLLRGGDFDRHMLVRQLLGHHAVTLSVAWFLTTAWAVRSSRS